MTVHRDQMASEGGATVPVARSDLSLYVSAASSVNYPRPGSDHGTSAFLEVFLADIRYEYVIVVLNILHEKDLIG